VKAPGRRKFMGTAISVFGLASLSFAGLNGSVNENIELELSGKTIRLKGKQNSKVTQWDIITIGNLGRNRYWGESEEKSHRDTICTCTLIRGDGFCILTDPSIADEKKMASELERRTGLKPSDIKTVFLTHEHADHFYGIKNFPDAKWIAAPAVAEIINKSGQLPRTIEGSTEILFDTIKVIPTPGHTYAHHSLVFDCDGLRIVIAADSIMTKDFFRERKGYFRSVDLKLATETINMLAEMADIIVPGHDNCFFNF